MDFRERLMEALRIAGKTRAQLADEIGVSAASISNWTLGKARSLKGQTAVKIEAVTGVRARWIMTGEGPKLVGDDQSSELAPSGKCSVPRIPTSAAGEWPENPDPYAHDNRPLWLVTDLPVSKRAFALSVDGLSMSPLFQPGEHIIVDPQVPPAPGSFVVADVQGQGVLIRKYRPLKVGANGFESFELVPANDDYPAIHSDDSAIKILGTVIEHRRVLANPGMKTGVEH
jgi:bacteriophage CI repressor helix-turn-helix domain